MILQLEDWVFDTDVQQTADYSNAEAAEHCTCGYCRNYYQTVDAAYPDLRDFFHGFGLNMEAPNELMPYVDGDQIRYYGVFAACGRILVAGTKPFLINGIRIVPNAHNDQQINYGCSDPCFFLEFSNVVLPWALDEDIEDVQSDAKDPSFVRKMWDRIFGKPASRDYIS